MAYNSCQQFCEDLRSRLSNKGYAEMNPPAPLNVAMLKQTFGGNIPKVVAVIDASYISDPPTKTFSRVQGWIKQLLGRGGAGVVLFVYNQPLASAVNEISQLGKGLLGYGQVVAGTYDLLNNQYWLSDHMGWPEEIFR